MKPPTTIGTRVAVTCPECGLEILVPIEVHIEGTGAEVNMVATPLMADLRAHMWTHGVEPTA